MMKNKLAKSIAIALLATGMASSGSMLSEQSAEAAPKYTRKTPKLKIDVKKTNRTTGLERKKIADEKETVPDLTSDGFIKIETLKKNIANAVIGRYIELIEDSDPEAAEMPDLYFRLAEAYAQKQRYWRFRAMKMYPDIDKAKGSKKRKLQDKQKLYFKTEKKALLKSLKVYGKLAAEPRFKDYPRMDEVLFYFGYTLDGVKRIVESRKIYQQLIMNYPKSKYIPQAFLSFADYFFEKDQLDNAEKFYDKVLQFPKSSVYSFALYKKGWVYLNQDRPQDALEAFFKVSTLTKNDRNAKALNRASKKDFVRAYAQVGRADKGYQAFQRVDRKYAFTMLKILGSIYLGRGEGEKAIFTYRQLIGIESKNKDVCEWQGNILSAMLSVGNQKQKTAEIVNLVNVYSAHKKSKILKGGKLEECRDNAQGTAGEMAKTWHNEAIKTLNPQALGSVETLYNLYIKSFPKADDIGQMRYYYADLLWQRAEYEKNPRKATDRWERAAIAFTDVVEGGTLKGKLLKEAAFAAVLGWKNALAVDPRTKAPKTVISTKPGKVDVPKPKPIGERELKMIAAFDVYIKYIKDPSDDELVMMKFLKARIFWRADRLDDSMPLFYDIVEKHPEHETAGWAANILLDNLNRLQKYAELTKLAKSMLANKKFMEDKDELKDTLGGIVAVGMRKAAEQLESDGRHIACGRAYNDIYEANPTAPGMDEVLFNSGVCFNSGKSIGLAIRSFAILNKKFPKAEKAKKALVLMGNAYGAIASYEKAAEKYEEFARRFPGEKEAAGALNNAVTYRKGIGQQKEAIANIEGFVKKYRKKQKEQAAAAMFGLAGIYEAQGNNSMVIRVYRRYLKEIGKSGGTDRMLIANAKMGEILWKESCKSGGVDGACVRVTRERATRKRKGKKRRGLQLPTQCGAKSKIKINVQDRDRRRVKEAQKYFQAAITLAKKGAVKGAPKERQAAAIYWMAASRFYMNGSGYEKFLSLKFPTKLAFPPNNPKKTKESLKRFKKWLEDKSKLMASVQKNYLEIKDIKGGGAAWAVASA
ncbi:MAG: tetratricopeptide repeat protein, partial [Kofleriaceae bacterium]|nr:tetratricopeptide repeat protein [Kofleriaceae bacterium]